MFFASATITVDSRPLRSTTNGRFESCALLSMFSGRPFHLCSISKRWRTAKALMTEAVNWSVMRWLGEKKRVRKHVRHRQRQTRCRRQRIKSLVERRTESRLRRIAHDRDACGKGNSLNEATERKPTLIRRSYSSPRLSNKPTRRPTAPTCLPRTPSSARRRGSAPAWQGREAVRQSSPGS